MAREKVLCPVDGCGREMFPGNIPMHLKASHPGEAPADAPEDGPPEEGGSPPTPAPPG